jgi:hypothetical protein
MKASYLMVGDLVQRISNDEEEQDTTIYRIIEIYNSVVAKIEFVRIQNANTCISLPADCVRPVSVEDFVGNHGYSTFFRLGGYIKGETDTEYYKHAKSFDDKGRIDHLLIQFNVKHNKCWKITISSVFTLGDEESFFLEMKVKYFHEIQHALKLANLELESRRIGLLST